MDDESVAGDICIIGSGPAGSTIFHELAGTGLRLILLESGGLQRRPDTDALNEIESVGAPRVLDQWLVRNRMLGGSSHTWTGRCAPFDEIDFQRRDWVPHSGWPFGLEEVAPYLDRAAPYLGLGFGTGYNGPGFWAMTRHVPPLPDIDRSLLEAFFWQYSRDARNPYDSMRFGPSLAAPDARVLRNVTAIHLNTNPDGTAIESVEVAAEDGSRRRITAPAIILCAGAIENARLLLASNRTARAGLGNTRGLVGRFLMDHPRGPVAACATEGSAALQKRYGLYSARTPAGSRLFRHGLRLSPAVQAREGLLNATAWLSEVVMPDDPWHALKRILRRKADTARDSAILARNMPLLARGLHQYFIQRRGLPRKISALEIDAMVEQRPDPDSRVTLAERTDRFGVPLSRIDWRINEQEQRTMRRMAELVAQEFARTGLALPVLHGWVQEPGPFPDHFRDVAHPTGTTRMARDPSQGVVDANGEVHGIHGLFVAGSSVFPTSGHANPTHMIVALAIRMADSIKARQGWRPPFVDSRRSLPPNASEHAAVRDTAKID